MTGVGQRWFATVALALAALPAGAAWAAPPLPRERLARARDLWAAQHVTSYRFRLRISCDCAGDVRRAQVITVLGGRPRGARFFPGQLQTFPQMFRLIGQVLADPNAEGAIVTYDSRRGFPRSVRLDAITWRVDRFVAL